MVAKRKYFSAIIVYVHNRPVELLKAPLGMHDNPAHEAAIFFLRLANYDSGKTLVLEDKIVIEISLKLPKMTEINCNFQS